MLGLHGALQYKAAHLKFLHVFWIDNYQKMDWREPEMIVKVGEWSRYTSQVRASNNIVSFGNEAWSEDLILFDSTRVLHKPLRPVCDHYWVFLGNCYFWNTSLAKICCGEVCSHPISELTRPPKIQLIFFAGGTSWTLDCCKARLNFTIFMNE